MNKELENQLVKFLKTGLWYGEYVRLESQKDEIEDALRVLGGAILQAEGIRNLNVCIRPYLHLVRLPLNFLDQISTRELETTKSDIEHGNFEVTSSHWFERNPNIISIIDRILSKRKGKVGTSESVRDNAVEQSKQATYIPGVLGDFKDERTNDAAALLFHHYNVERGFAIDKAIKLVWQQLRFSDLDLSKPSPQEMEEKAKRTKMEMEKLQREFDRKKRTR